MSEYGYGHVAIYCRDCSGMFYASDADPLVIADDVKNIKKYCAAGHRMKPVSVEDVKKNFGNITCLTCRPR